MNRETNKLFFHFYLSNCFVISNFGAPKVHSAPPRYIMAPPRYIRRPLGTSLDLAPPRYIRRPQGTYAAPPRYNTVSKPRAQWYLHHTDEDGILGKIIYSRTPHFSYHLLPYFSEPSERQSRRRHRHLQCCRTTAVLLCVLLAPALTASVSCDPLLCYSITISLLTSC